MPKESENENQGEHFSQNPGQKSQITFWLHNVACSSDLFSWMLFVNGYGANISHEKQSCRVNKELADKK